jgi:hypothetical protein
MSNDQDSKGDFMELRGLTEGFTGEARNRIQEAVWFFCYGAYRGLTEGLSIYAAS